MKVKFVVTPPDNTPILTLRGETDEEREFLGKAFKEGLRVFGGGSYTSLALPSSAGLSQLHLNSAERAGVAYAIGYVHGEGEPTLNNILSKLLGLKSE